MTQQKVGLVFPVIFQVLVNILTSFENLFSVVVKVIQFTAVFRVAAVVVFVCFNCLPWC